MAADRLSRLPVSHTGRGAQRMAPARKAGLHAVNEVAKALCLIYALITQFWSIDHFSDAVFPAMLLRRGELAGAGRAARFGRSDHGTRLCCRGEGYKYPYRRK